MEFHDVLYGPIQIGMPFNQDLLSELIRSPEVERLRNMRLMNFSVPLIQELGSSKRFPHSVGVCYLAQKVGSGSLKSERDLSELMVAALLHDAAIPPYGHLVEVTLRKSHPGFDHEAILGQLLDGTYHATNIHHQIVPGRTLKVGKILHKYKIDPTRVLELVKPRPGKQSAISAQIDLDNIDNVHRMAHLMGWEGAKENLLGLIDSMRINSKLQIEFKPKSISLIRYWQDIRQKLYTLIIGHPECVAQNAFQSDLVKAAVESGVIIPDTWFINEPTFEAELRANKQTRALARQLISGSEYRLLDYVWFTGLEQSRGIDWKTVDEQVKNRLPALNSHEHYFTWVESGLISRPVDALMSNGERKRVGRKSQSFMIALVHTRTDSLRPQPLSRSKKDRWRNLVREAFQSIVGDWEGSIVYPESYSGDFFAAPTGVSQLGLC